MAIDQYIAIYNMSKFDKETQCGYTSLRGWLHAGIQYMDGGRKVESGDGEVR